MLTQSKRGPLHDYVPSCIAHNDCLEIAIGNLVLVDGAPWLNEWQGNYKDEALSSFKLRNDFVQKKLFTHAVWPRVIRRARPRTQAAQAAEDLQALARGDTETEDKAAFEFKEIAMQTCVVKYSRKGDFEHVRVANFTFVKIVRTQTWTEPGKNRHASVTWPA